nr:MAG TPA_asm: hypothetical protein [Caudoviricetes sp.]
MSLDHSGCGLYKQARRLYCLVAPRVVMPVKLLGCTSDTLVTCTP